MLPTRVQGICLDLFRTAVSPQILSARYSDCGMRVLDRFHLSIHEVDVPIAQILTSDDPSLISPILSSMSSYLDDPDGAEIRSLPQCGFGSDIDFNTLIKSNHFVFRVYTPKERPPLSDDTDPFFLAPRFDEHVARSPVDLPKIKFSEPSIGSYEEVARHMEWTTRTSSSYISTSFSFSWSIWEAVRRYHQGMKKDVEIAIIDASALGGRAATAVQLLQKSSPAERTEKYWKWHRFSQESQSVLVYGMVPRTAVLASVPLLQILRKMPSYFLRKDVQTIYGNPLDQVGWDFALRKHNYRQFCEDMSKVFLDRSPEVKLRDSTAGSVRLALSFLRPFFHRVVQEDFDIAISYLRTLAITISEWPGDEWVRDHGEICKIIETMVLALGEELREKYFSQKQEEITRLQLVIQELQQTIQTHNAGSKGPTAAEVVEIELDDDFDIGFEDSEEPTMVTLDLPPVSKPEPLQTSFAVLPGIPVIFRTPITPPESPRNSLFVRTTTATITLGDIVPTPSSPEQIVEASQHEDEHELPVCTNNSPKSEEPASPPPTPPSESPIFLPRILSPIIEDPVSCNEEFVGPLENESNIQLSSKCAVEDKEPCAQFVPEQEQEEQEDVTSDKERLLEELGMEGEALGTLEQEPFLDLPEELETNGSLHNGIPMDEDEDEGEKTDLELTSEPELQDPPSPTTPWIFVPRTRPKVSSFSSTRSSIASLDTLCDPSVDFPLKRFSLPRAESFEYVPPHPSFRSFSIVSRTVSFSEPSPNHPLSPAPNPAAIPLPPSPQVSLSSLSSSRSTLSLPPSPSPLRLGNNSLDSRLSSPSVSHHSTRLHSVSSSASGSLPATPTHLSPSLPPVPVGVIIPPKGRISLLSPLPEVQDVDDDDDRNSIRSIKVAETASYIVTGFIVGAFITLFLFSTQRRQLLMLT